MLLFALYLDDNMCFIVLSQFQSRWETVAQKGEGPSGEEEALVLTVSSTLSLIHQRKEVTRKGMIQE
jgi:thioredoxin reductase